MSDFTFAEAIALIKKFTKDRNWGKYHKPKDLTLKLMEEVGELAEHFQWKSEEELEDYLSQQRSRDEAGEEAIDVLVILLMIMKDCLDLDIEAAFKSKLAKNNDKYPVEVYKE
jgi:NTP pyrophosphatase (non-canonical NTP hydrolase)